MLKAKQQVLAQTTNTRLIDIRRLELRYFTNYFNTFGSNATLFCGFLFGSVTQVLAKQTGAARAAKDLYWMASFVCMAVVAAMADGV